MTQHVTSQMPLRAQTTLGIPHTAPFPLRISPSFPRAKSHTPRQHVSSEFAAPSVVPFDYASIDAEDPDIKLSFFRSFPIFGFSPRQPNDDRYKALAKLKKVAAQHGVSGVGWTDIALAITLFASHKDRSAKEALKKAADASARKTSHVHKSRRALPTLVRFPLRKPHLSQLVQRVSAKSMSLPPDEPRRWSISTNDIYDTPPESSSPEKSAQAESRNDGSLDEGNGQRRWSLPESVIFEKRMSSPTQISELHAQLLYHMLRHADSIYGLPLTVTTAPRVSLTKLSDRAIVCARTGIARADLRQVRFQAQPFQPAYYVAVDRQIRAVVICVRGTANLVDSLTDLAVTAEPFRVRRLSSPQGSKDGAMSTSTGSLSDGHVDGLSHAGILRSARNLYQLVRDDVLDALEENSGFQVFVTGHSLGAATAAILSMILRDDTAMPGVYGVCFAPPPCMTYDLAEQSSSCTVTVVNGPDIVPRMSIPILLPFFATLQFVSQMSKSRKVLLSLGLGRIAIDKDEFEAYSNRSTAEMEQHHDGNRMFVPGKVFQLVPRNEVHRRDVVKNRLFNKKEVDIIHVSRAKFLQVRGRERGMLSAHAPLLYRQNLMKACEGMGVKPPSATTSAQRPSTLVGGQIMRLVLGSPHPAVDVRKSEDTRHMSLDDVMARLEERDGSPLPL